MFTRYPVLTGTALLLLIALILTLAGNAGAGRFTLITAAVFAPVALVWNWWLNRRSGRR